MADWMHVWWMGLRISVLVAAFISIPLQAQVKTIFSEERFVSGEAMLLDVPLDSTSILKGGYPIDSSGFADLPVLGLLEVGGKTRTEVEEYLALKLANYLRDTHIRAVPAIRLTLLGFWTRQGQYYVSPKATVWDAAYLAGGMAGERTLDKITVRRGEQKLKISFLDEYSRGRTLESAGIRSGDIFVMPVPRDNTGAWYWFTQSLTVTAQVATIASTLLTVYITYYFLDHNTQPR